MIESISSMKITLGALSAASANSPFMSFSPSPIHLDVSVLALQLKKVDLHSVAIAFASIVLPLPGGPYRRMPFDGDSSPLKMSGRTVGKMICSYRTFLTSTSPFTSSHLTFGDESKIVSSIDLSTSLSMCADRRSCLSLCSSVLPSIWPVFGAGMALASYSSRALFFASSSSRMPLIIAATSCFLLSAVGSIPVWLS